MSKFQQKIIQEYKAKGYKVLKVIKLSESGFPDLLCIKKGLPNLWIECKEKNDILKPLQKLRINELIQLGNDAICLQDSKGLIYGTGLKIENKELDF